MPTPGAFALNGFALNGLALNGFALKGLALNGFTPIESVVSTWFRLTPLAVFLRRNSRSRTQASGFCAGRPGGTSSATAMRTRLERAAPVERRVSSRGCSSGSRTGTGSSSAAGITLQPNSAAASPTRLIRSSGESSVGSISSWSLT